MGAREVPSLATWGRPHTATGPAVRLAPLPICPLGIHLCGSNARVAVERRENRHCVTYHF